MKEEFKLVNLDNIEIKVEEEKRRVNTLSIKLLSNLRKEKFGFDNDEEINMTEEEIKFIEHSLLRRDNIIIFLHQLNKFRRTGKLRMNKKTEEIFCRLLNKTLEKINETNDIYSANNILILSQTYYYKNGDKKEYLQKKINQEFFKKEKFWEDLFDYEMNKEITKLSRIERKRLEENNFNLVELTRYDKNRYGKLAFGKIMTLTNNMLDYGFNSDEIYKVMKPKIKFYQLSKDLVVNIKCILNKLDDDDDDINNNDNENSNKDEEISNDEENNENNKQGDKSDINEDKINETSK